MYGCPNCGSNLKFNIKLQKMACDHCDSTFNPYQFGETEGAKQSDLEVTVFTCPQCAGELYTTDNEMAGFCSFCGSTTVFESRIANEKRPDYIIPFIKTKDDCKEEYMKIMREAFFVPKTLKSPEYIEGFRGIYMPYWIYDVKQQGKLSLSGSRKTVDNDYVITSHYHFEGNLSAQYEGVAYDGSSSFSDNMSRRLIPYKINSVREFSPVFLSGFYADAADVEAAVYEEDVKDLTEHKTGEYVKNYYGLASYQIESNDDSIREQLGTTITKTSQVMLPVWFMSYRNKDWVAYAAVNGQTGKVVADLPVDFCKYLLFAILLTLPFFSLCCILDGVLTILPAVLLEILLLISTVVSQMYATKVKQIVEREKSKNDKGALVTQLRKENKQLKNRGKKKKLKRERDIIKKRIIAVAVLVFIAYVLLLLWEDVSYWIEDLPYRQIFGVVAMAAATATILTSLISLIRSRGMKLWRFIPTPFYCMLTTVLSVVILILRPTGDVGHYAGILLSCGAIIYTLMDLIKRYNMMATRRLPQFERGGDIHA